MAQLFQRSCVVIVDDLRVEGLRCVFKISKTLEKEPNTLDLKITNLSQTSRARMQKKGAKVVLSAGYSGNAAVIFSGDARTVDHVREGPDWTTHIQCGDGERAYALARFSRSYKSGTPLATIINDAAASLGINVGNLKTMLGGVTGVVGHGYAAHGFAAQELDKLLRLAGLRYSVQDGAVQVLKAGGTLPGTAILLSPATGLVGSPDHGTPDAKGKPSVLKAKCLLNPLIHCGSALSFDSLAVKGQFHVKKLEHEGDSAGGNWYTSTESTAG